MFKSPMMKIVAVLPSDTRHDHDSGRQVGQRDLRDSADEGDDDVMTVGVAKVTVTFGKSSSFSF